jgi:hypothetical protein
MNTGIRILLVVLAGLAVIVPAQAKECREAVVTATSREYISRSLGAFPASWAAWRKIVKNDIGDGWQAWRRAENREIRCDQVNDVNGNKRWTCTRSARPCRPGSGGGRGDAVGGNTGAGSTDSGWREPRNDLPAIDQILRRGMKNAQVETLQYLLREAGYDLALDGHFGRSTEDAVRDFQKKNKLKVDGRAGPYTIEALTS